MSKECSEGLEKVHPELNTPSPELTRQLKLQLIHVQQSNVQMELDASNQRLSDVEKELKIQKKDSRTELDRFTSARAAWGLRKEELELKLSQLDGEKNCQLTIRECCLRRTPD